MTESKQKYICDDGTEITCEKGKKSEKDFKIYTRFPNSAKRWPHTLEYIGQCLRLKSEVEDINYPKTVDGIKTGNQGKDYLFDFMRWCIYHSTMSIKELCEKFKIPKRE